MPSIEAANRNEHAPVIDRGFCAAKFAEAADGYDPMARCAYCRHKRRYHHEENIDKQEAMRAMQQRLMENLH